MGRKPVQAIKVPAKLWQCKTFDEQVGWVKAKLEAGATVTDPGLWLSGADPEKVIRKLRKDGMRIDTVRVQLRDAADELHKNVPAWRLQADASAPPAAVSQ